MVKRKGAPTRQGGRPQAVCVEGQAAPPASPIKSVSNARGELDASCRRAALDGEKLCGVVDPALRTSDPRRRSDMGNAGRPTAPPARRLWPSAHASCFPCVALVVVPRLASLTAKHVALRCHDARREENRVASRAVHARGWVPLDAHRYNKITAADAVIRFSSPLAVQRRGFGATQGGSPPHSAVAGTFKNTARVNASSSSGPGPPFRCKAGVALTKGSTARIRTALQHSPHTRRSGIGTRAVEQGGSVQVRLVRSSAPCISHTVLKDTYGHPSHCLGSSCDDAGFNRTAEKEHDVIVRSTVIDRLSMYCPYLLVKHA